MEESKLLNAELAAEKLYVSKRTLLKWARDGKIEHRRVSRKVILFSKDVVENFGQVIEKSEEPIKTESKRAGRKSLLNKRKGDGRTSGELPGNLRKEVMSWL